MDYIFIIYSCQKNLSMANQTYAKIHDKLNNMKVYILFGNEAAFGNEAVYKIIDDKYIVLNVKDDYDHLADKTLLLMQTITQFAPDLKGIFKCDDDIVINMNHLNAFIVQNNADYVGKYVLKNKEIILNCLSEQYVPECIYCGGPLYFLTRKAVDCFVPPNKVVHNYYEDVMVGNHLNTNGIFPAKDYDLYSDYIGDSPFVSYHNKKHTNELFVIVQGGLGNQLFQLACAMQMAEKYNKKLVINVRAVIPSPHQNNNINTTISTILNLFPTLCVIDKQVTLYDYYEFKETTNECFVYTEQKLNYCFETYANVVLRGYFIHFKYIPQHIFEQIQVKPNDVRLLTVDFTNTYFIHIRLGDYLKTPMYHINLRSYYKDCIERIRQSNPVAKFYICTNQYDQTLKEFIKFNNLPTDMNFTLQDRANNDLDTLYIMAACEGGVCANSTLSFMGAVLQKNKRKECIFMPYPMVNFTDGFNAENVPRDMYPDWCSVYDTINNKFVKDI
jgi:hypothetical protein